MDNKQDLENFKSAVLSTAKAIARNENIKMSRNFVENAIERYESLTQDALLLLRNVSYDNDEQTEKLENLANYIINRES